MRYLFAIIAPPVALLICGKPVQFVVNLVLWLASFPLLFLFGSGFILWFVCMIHALAVCGAKRQDKQLNKLVKAIEGRNEQLASADR